MSQKDEALATLPVDLPKLLLMHAETQLLQFEHYLVMYVPFSLFGKYNC